MYTWEKNLHPLYEKSGTHVWTWLFLNFFKKNKERGKWLPSRHATKFHFVGVPTELDYASKGGHVEFLKIWDRQGDFLNLVIAYVLLLERIYINFEWL